MNFNYQLYRTWVRLTHQVEKDPVFILGNQKTGTSAIAALLGEATGQTYTIDVFCHLGPLQNRLFNNEISFKQFISHSKDFFDKKIIKEPSFTFFYEELVNIYPTAKFLLIIRDPFENVRSICNRLKLDGKDRDPKVSLANLHDDWSHITDGKAYGHEGATIIETLALRAEKCYQVYLNNKQNIHLIKYESFVQNKQVFIQQLAEQLNWSLEHSIDHLVNKQFQPGGIDISPNDFFSEENYELIKSSCKELIAREYSHNL